MDPDSTQIILVILFLLLSAAFSASETAIMASSRIKIKSMANEGNRGATRAFVLLGNTDKLISAILIGNNIANISLTTLVAGLSIKWFGNSVVVSLITTVAVTVLVLLFAELTPKIATSHYPEAVLCKIALFVLVSGKILFPISFLFSFVTGGIVSLFVKDKDKPVITVTEEELKTMVNVGHEEGVIEPSEKEMIDNVFEFGDSYAKDIMIPRADMTALNVNSSYEQVIEVFRNEQYSRLPVFEDDLDNIIGILFVKDLLLKDFTIKAFSIKSIMRKAHFSYELKPISDLFSEMRAKNATMTVIIDEYGGTAGIITLEDIVEEIVGDINDEYDQVEEDFQNISENVYNVSGSAKIDEFCEELGVTIESEDYDTIGGFVVGLLEHMPKALEQVTYDNILFTVLNANKNRIMVLRAEIIDNV